MSINPCHSKSALAAVILLTTLQASGATIIRREAAGALFETRDTSGCIVTRVDIAGLREYITGSTERAPASSLAETFISRRNECTGVELIRASESGEQTVTYTPNTLNRAFLDGTFNLYDYVTSQLYVVQVHLVWEGEGKITQTETDTQTHTIRDARATGTLLLNGENLTPGDSVSAAIERIRIRD